MIGGSSGDPAEEFLELFGDRAEGERGAGVVQRPPDHVRAIMRMLEQTRGEIEELLRTPPVTANVRKGEALGRKGLEVAPERLLALDRLEQRLEVPVAEAARAVPLDHLEEERRAVLRRLREDL